MVDKTKPNQTEPDLHMINNLLKTVHTFARCMVILLSVDEILLPRYVNWSTNFKGLPINMEMAPSCFKVHELYLCLCWVQCLLIFRRKYNILHKSALFLFTNFIYIYIYICVEVLSILYLHLNVVHRWWITCQGESDLSMRKGRLYAHWKFHSAQVVESISWAVIGYQPRSSYASMHIHWPTH